jgi:hypothetical protein
LSKVEEKVSMDIEEIARIIVDAAIKVHRALGPGSWSRPIKCA